ncbi:hypothetical protein WJX79_000831 [Trebouxia sp. C0005]
MIVCAAVLGQTNNPLYLEVFQSKGKQEDALKFHYIMHCALDAVEEKVAAPRKAPGEVFDTYLGMLYPTEDFKVYGSISNTRIKFMLVVDEMLQKEDEMRMIFKRFHTAYVDAVSNPFYTTSTSVTSKRFDARSKAYRIVPFSIGGAHLQAVKSVVATLPASQRASRPCIHRSRLQQHALPQAYLPSSHNSGLKRRVADKLLPSGPCQPKEYTCFNVTLDKLRDDPRVTVRLGTPISGYGQESRNRAARQRIPHRAYNDDSGTEHFQVQFHAKGPTGAALISADMYQDAAKQWQYAFLFVDVTNPTPQRLVLIGPQY